MLCQVHETSISRQYIDSDAPSLHLEICEAYTAPSIQKPLLFNHSKTAFFHRPPVIARCLDWLIWIWRRAAASESCSNRELERSFASACIERFYEKV